MNNWKIFGISWLLVSLLIISYLVSNCLDQGISFTYMSQGYKNTIDDLEILGQIFPNWYSKKDITYILRNQYPNELIVEDSMSVRIKGLRFDFNDNSKLIKINTRAYYEFNN
jgi:hypothetical protein